MKDVEKDFAGEMMMKTSCREETFARVVFALLAKKSRDKVKNSSPGKEDTLWTP